MALNEYQSRELIGKNLRYLMYVYGISSQKELAEMLDVSAAMLCKVINGEQYPSVFPFLANVENKFGVSISAFLFTDLTTDPTVICPVQKKEELVKRNLGGYEGAYQTYYHSEDGNSLKSGVLLIKKYDSKLKAANVTFVFRMAPEYASICLEKTKGFVKNNCYIDADNYLTSFSNDGMVFKGTLTFSDNHMYFNLKNTSNGVEMFIAFHKPLSEKHKYLGGLGLMTVVGEYSRDNVLIQRYVGISRESLKCCDKEIQDILTIKKCSKEDYSREVKSILDKYKEGILSDIISYDYDDHEMLAVVKLNKLVNKNENHLGGTISLFTKSDDIWCDLLRNELKKIV